MDHVDAFDVFRATDTDGSQYRFLIIGPTTGSDGRTIFWARPIFPVAESRGDVDPVSHVLFDGAKFLLGLALLHYGNGFHSDFRLGQCKMEILKLAATVEDSLPFDGYLVDTEASKIEGSLGYWSYKDIKRKFSSEYIDSSELPLDRLPHLISLGWREVKAFFYTPSYSVEYYIISKYLKAINLPGITIKLINSSKFNDFDFEKKITNQRFLKDGIVYKFEHDGKKFYLRSSNYIYEQGAYIYFLGEFKNENDIHKEDIYGKFGFFLYYHNLAISSGYLQKTGIRLPLIEEPAPVWREFQTVSGGHRIWSKNVYRILEDKKSLLTPELARIGFGHGGSLNSLKFWAITGWTPETDFRSKIDLDLANKLEYDEKKLFKYLNEIPVLRRPYIDYLPDTRNFDFNSPDLRFQLKV